MLIDTHAHLDMEDFEEDIKEVAHRAFENGIEQIISVGIDLSSSTKALELARKHSRIFSTVGFHPHHADSATQGDLERLAELARDPHVVAWGEIGLDYFRNRSTRSGQMSVFKKQLEIAAELRLPVVIHDREAHGDVLSCLEAMGGGRPRGVIHCFSGDLELAERFIALGFYISFPGTVTFPKAYTARDVAARIPLDRLFVETDAPYLAPVPFRGKRNEPAFAAHTAREIAKLRGIDFEELALRSSENARRLFGLPQPESVGLSM